MADFARTPKARVAVLISGAGSNMAALLYASRLPGAAYEIVLVASNDPDAAGLALADAEGLETCALSHKGMARAEHDAAMDAAIRASGADYVALAGYMRILTDDFVAKWRGRMLNIHPSLLPKYKGLDTHARAIDAGDSHGGVSVHLVTPELDAGEVLGQLPVAIRDGDTADDLAARVRLAEHQLYPRVLGEYVSRAYRADWLLEQVRTRALALPEAEERASHGAPGWRTAGKSGKYFAYFNDRHHGSEHIALLVKTSGPDEMESLIERAPEAYFKPAFYGASGWIGVILDRPGLDWQSVEDWLERSWAAVAPKRLASLQRAAAEL
ncbi:phosphoribosylglycinamide formyltransferase [Alteriqipengyuania sp. WL0013]|uniref:phosphoribosylglycinamide formyltransferase n=1 Tax=Alteriqipengyuania sp. WL0013 TaxID=3110773 RepID=UPI002C2BDD3A|nr:phosphoribosylglycinamide formyltransferase [Alteriqipengyuania sp. WL0013]MEB3415651.1 phosphoribosylglycinamide formyltransferase [Alteriqipengyuania sp. WL0013]